MIIDQLIELKKECQNTFNETYAQLYRHYKIVLADSRIELLEDEGDIVGFMEWIRQPNIEFPMFKPDYNAFKGRYLYIINAIVKKGNIWDLIKRIRKKNKTAEYVVYDRPCGRKIHKLKEV
jgi:hypothetical protein